MSANQGLSELEGRTISLASDVGEGVEGLVIKWFLLTGMLGFVVCAFMVA
jgi:hypothetical protein